MNKGSFSLQAAQFSDSDSQTPMQQMMTSYNRQYSLIYQQIKQFLKQCKENINKYIQLNQFGARFNMYALLGQMAEIETSALTGVSDVKKQQLENQRNIKNHYQKQFQNILKNMANVIKDFLKFQVDFKREYFGWNISQNQSSKNSHKIIPSLKNPVLGKLSSSQSIKSGDSKLKRSLVMSEKDQQKETQLQQKLRQILKRKLAPQRQNIIKFCDKESDPFKNMLKLQQKIDMMQSEVILSRNKEEKIIQIFNKRRIQNIQPKGQNLVHCELIETNVGSQQKVNDTKSSQSSKDNQKRESLVGKIESEMNVKENEKKVPKPSMDIKSIKSHKHINREDGSEFGFMLPNSSSTPRRMNDLKSPLQRANGSKLNFFGSPKAMLGKNKAPGIQFKKKRQPQDQQTQSTIQQGSILFKQQQSNIMKKIKQQESIAIQKQSHNHNPNKNRDQFLSRRKSNNNQAFLIGASSLIE